MEETKENKISLTTQGTWLMIAKIIGFALSFLLPFMVVRILSKSDFGIYQEVFLVIVNANSLLAFGMGMSMYYYLSRERENRRFYVFNVLFFNFVIGGLACLFLNIYPQFLGNLFKNDELTRMAPQIGFVIWLWMFSAFLEIVAIANQEAKLATGFIVFAQLTKMLLMVSAVYYLGTVQSMLNAVTIQVILQTIVLLFYLNSRFKGFWHSFDRKILVQQLQYAIPFGLMGVLWILQSESHNYFIGYRFSEEELGIYRVGCFELPLLAILYESVSAVLIPRMSELQLQGKIREMIELSARASEKLALFYFPVFILFLITATTFITTLFTGKFLAAVPIFLINITLLPTYVLITDPIVRTYEQLGKYILKVRIVIVGLMLFTLWIGMQYLDLKGMIIIVVVTALIERVITLSKICVFLDLKTQDLSLMKNVGKIAIAAVLAGIPTYFIYNLVMAQIGNLGERISLLIFEKVEIYATELISGAIILGITGLFFVCIYIGLLFYLRIFTEREKEFVQSKLTGLLSFNR